MKQRFVVIRSHDKSGKSAWVVYDKIRNVILGAFPKGMARRKADELNERDQSSFDKKLDERLYVVKDFQSRPDDKWCICGTQKDLAKALASKIECSMEASEIAKIPEGKTLYWVDFHQLNWAGCGGGSSELFTNLGDVQRWIIEKIKEWHIDIGEVKFEIYPVYRVESDEK